MDVIRFNTKIFIEDPFKSLNIVSSDLFNIHKTDEIWVIYCKYVSENWQKFAYEALSQLLQSYTIMFYIFTLNQLQAGQSPKQACW